MPGSKVYTAEARVYRSLPSDYIHEFVNHMESYVSGRVHANGLENFWSLLKRGLYCPYVAVEPFHLHPTLMSKCSATIFARMSTATS